MGPADEAPPPEPAYRYDAFISYRHVEPDRKWAKWLHSSLETYRVPPKLVERGGVRPRLRRVFRDEEELPASADLNQEIESALRESRFLIVVCSPRTPRSMWVNREIERFREMGRHDRILALLIEGEPGESFPRALREIRRVAEAHGLGREQIEEVEPLAADVRSGRSEGPGHLSRMAKLRLLACVLGCRFDDLRQREQERRTRRMASFGIAAASLACVMIGLTAFAFTQRGAAVASANEARENARRAVEGEALARLRLADGLISEGEALRQSGRWVEARSCFLRSRVEFISAGLSPIEADVGLWGLGLEAPPELLTYVGHGAAVRAVAVSPDGRTGLSASDDGTLKWWDLPTGTEIRTLKGHTGRVLGVTFAGPGTAVSASADGTLKLWDLAAGRDVRTFKGHIGPVNAVAVSPDSRRAVSGGRDESVRLWDLATGEGPRVLGVHDADVYTVAFSPDGGRALSGGADTLLRLWDLGGATPARQMAGKGGYVLSAAFTPDGNSALASNGDSSMTLWDLKSGKELRTFTGHSSTVLGVAVSGDGTHALSASFDKTLKLWDLSGGPATMTLAAHEGSATSAAFAPEGRTALSGSEDKSVKLWSLGDDRGPLTFTGHGGAVTSVAFSRDGRTVLTGSSDATIKLWDAATGRELRSCGGPSGVTGVALLPDGRRALSVGADKLMRLWDVAGGTLLHTYAGHDGPLQCVAVSAGGKFALSGGWDRTAKLWDLADGRLVRSLNDAGGAVNCVAFTPDGAGALSGGVDGTLKLWDLHGGTIRRRFAGHALYIFAVAISPDGKTALSGGYDRTLKWWDLSGGKELHTFTGHTDVVHGVAFSPDGRLAASASADHTIRLWDLYAGKDLRTFTADDGEVDCVAFSPDGRAVLSGGRSGTARLWDFGRVDRQVELSAAVAASQSALAGNRNDAAALGALGRWYAFRGVNDWAVDLLERARAGGATVDPVMMARCYWELSDDPPSGSTRGSTRARADCLAAARREFDKALAAAGDEEGRFYLRLCLSAVERAAAQPTTSPQATSASQPKTN